MQNIVQKIKKANLTGRGGACFPTADKWQMVKKAKGAKKYVVCNASEGEPGIKKDKYLLEKKIDYVIDGILIAINYLEAEKAYIYLNPDYYNKFGKNLKKIIGTLPIEVFKKQHKAGYIGGEESSALNHIEGKRIEPRMRPPFPTTSGLFGQPTLINNVETFYDVSLIVANEYQGKRFYTINGDCLYDGVYELPEDWTIAEVLKKTDNHPDFDFFVQAGGDASGIVLNSSQLNQPVGGGGSITVHSCLKHNPVELMKYWINFFYNESCGQCTPCREGLHRLKEEIEKKELNWQVIVCLLDNLEDTSFCGLGCSVKTPFASYVNNILKNNDIKINLSVEQRQCLCECF